MTAEAPTKEQRPHWMDLPTLQIWVLPDGTLTEASVKQVDNLLANDAEVSTDVMIAYRKTLKSQST